MVSICSLQYFSSKVKVYICTVFPVLTDYICTVFPLVTDTYEEYFLSYSLPESHSVL